MIRKSKKIGHGRDLSLHIISLGRIELTTSVTAKTSTQQPTYKPLNNSLFNVVTTLPYSILTIFSPIHNIADLFIPTQPRTPSKSAATMSPRNYRIPNSQQDLGWIRREMAWLSVLFLLFAGRRAFRRLYTALAYFYGQSRMYDDVKKRNSIAGSSNRTRQR